MFWFVFLTVVVVLVAAGRWRSRGSQISSSGGRRSASGPSDPNEDGKRYHV